MTIGSFFLFDCLSNAHLPVSAFEAVTRTDAHLGDNFVHFGAGSCRYLLGTAARGVFLDNGLGEISIANVMEIIQTSAHCRIEMTPMGFAVWI